MKKHTDSWLEILLKKLPRFAGAIVGVVFTAIGGVMTVNAGLKTFVFGIETPRYFSASEMCKVQPWESVTEGEKPKSLTREEKKLCMEEKTAEARLKYQQERKENLIDGLAFLIVGVPFWIICGRKKKED